MKRQSRPGRANAKSASGIVFTLLLIVVGYYLFGIDGEQKPLPDNARPAESTSEAPPNIEFADPVSESSVPLPDDSIPSPRTVRVQRVVDGDTLRLPDNERVRLIGVDTPESVKPDSPVEPFGPEASDFTEKLVEGKTVTLRFGREEQDQYGRTLAYVYIDDVLLNELLIRQGFSRAQLQYDYSENMKDLFRRAETEARQNKRGIWSLSTKDTRDPR